MVTMRVEGLKELSRTLDQFASDVTKRSVLRSITREASKPLRQAIEDNMPPSNPNDADSYSIHDNIRIQSEKKRNRKATAQVRVGPARVKSTPEEKEKTGKSIVGGLSDSAGAPNYARILESRQGGIIRAFDTHGNRVPLEFKRRFAPVVERTAKRLAAKSRKRRAGG